MKPLMAAKIIGWPVTGKNDSLLFHSKLV